MSSPQAYAFPDAGQLNQIRSAEGDSAQNNTRAVEAAVARGYAEGFAHGQAAAALAAADVRTAAHDEGFATGREQGREETRQAAEALRQALTQITDCRAELLAQAESFCVELTLAMMARMIEANQVRADFIKHTLKAALAAFAPQLPRAIRVHPADLKSAAAAFPDLPVQADDSLLPGSARVEAGRLLAEAGIEQAFAQVRAAVLEIRARRARGKG